MQNELICLFEHGYLRGISEEDLRGLLDSPSVLLPEINQATRLARASYYVGLMRLPHSGTPLLIHPKLDDRVPATDYFAMLSTCMQLEGFSQYATDLFGIDWTGQPVSLEVEEDLLTPLLVMQFLRSTQQIVRKGLKKNFYVRQEELRSRVKGKILVGQTIRRYHFKERILDTSSRFETFGVDHAENQLLKKCLRSITPLCHAYAAMSREFSRTLHYVLPAFAQVSDEDKNSELSPVRYNPLFHEYAEAIRLACLLLKRLGYGVPIAGGVTSQPVPQFWINMSRLFELYAFAVLAKQLPGFSLLYQAKAKYGYVDFLLTSKGRELVIDAKYKPVYNEAGQYNIDDIRQLSGYARDRGVFHHLQIDPAEWSRTVVNCLVVYPSLGEEEPITEENLLRTPIDQFESFFKIGIRLPVKTV